MLDWADEHGIVVIDETAALSALTSFRHWFPKGNKPKELYSEEAVNGEILASATYRRLKS